MQEFLQFLAHRVPVRAPPVDAMAPGAFHVLGLCTENVGWYPSLNFFLTFLLEGHVAFETTGKGSELSRQVQFLNHLEYLLLWLITLDEHSLESPVVYQPSSHYLGISGQYHPVFGQSGFDHC